MTLNFDKPFSTRRAFCQPKMGVYLTDKRVHNQKIIQCFAKCFAQWLRLLVKIMRASLPDNISKRGSRLIPLEVQFSLSVSCVVNSIYFSKYFYGGDSQLCFVVDSKSP